MTLRLNGDSSGFTEIKAPNAAGDNSITLPTSNGGANQLLQNSGTAGSLQYTSAGDGLHYDSSGRLLVGTDTAPAGTDAQYTKFAIRGNTLNTNACYLSLGNRKTTTATTSNDNLGIITFNDNDADAGEYARIVGSASGDNAVNDYPGKLTFSTTGDGGSAPTPRIEINQTGALKLLAGCPGIDFSAKNTAGSGTDTMTSETLDGYEEGTFLPNAFGSTTIGSTVYALQYGAYVKIGRICHIQIRMSVTTMTGTGNLQIGGLPFTSMNDIERGYASISVPYISNLSAPAASDTYIGAYTAQNSTYMVMGALAPGQQFDEVQVQNGFTLLMGGTYITNA